MAYFKDFTRERSRIEPSKFTISFTILERFIWISKSKNIAPKVGENNLILTKSQLINYDFVYIFSICEYNNIVYSVLHLPPNLTHDLYYRCARLYADDVFRPK